MNTLNLGAGTRIIEGAVNHDIIAHPGVDVVHDLDDLPWPWADNSFDRIDARSVFEHLELTLLETLDECWRILRPDGALVLVYPVHTSHTSWDDPTHRWHWTPESLDYADPETRYGEQVTTYRRHDWEIVSRGVIKGRNVKAVLKPRGK